MVMSYPSWVVLQKLLKNLAYLGCRLRVNDARNFHFYAKISVNPRLFSLDLRLIWNLGKIPKIVSERAVMQDDILSYTVGTFIQDVKS